MNKNILLIEIIAIIILISGCVSETSTKHADEETLDKKEVMNCDNDPLKNKLAVIVKEDGLYDDSEVFAQIASYFSSVKKDLDIDAIEIQKFKGDSISELDVFIEELYQTQNVGFFSLVGDDLLQRPEPIPDNKCVELCEECPKEEECKRTMEVMVKPTFPWPSDTNIGDLFVVNGSASSHSCVELALSFILPPIKSSQNKKEFILDVFKRYTDFHNNPDSFFNNYSKEILEITSFTTENEDFLKGTQYMFNTTTIADNGAEKIEGALKRKPVVLVLTAHTGTTTRTIDHRIGTLSGWSEWVEEGSEIHEKDEEGNIKIITEQPQGLPSLFINDLGCEGSPLIDYEQREVPIEEYNEDYNDYLEDCCWPQTFLKTGVLAVYSGFPVDIFKNRTIGESIKGLKGSTGKILFGDVLAHLPNSWKN